MTARRQDGERMAARRALLRPAMVEWTCPDCGRQDTEYLIEDDDGALSQVHPADRFIWCGGCGEFLDIGWAAFPASAPGETEL